MQAQGRAPSALALAVCMAAEPVLLSVFSKMLRGPRVHLKPGPRSPAGAFTTAVCVRDGKHPSRAASQGTERTQGYKEEVAFWAMKTTPLFLANLHCPYLNPEVVKVRTSQAS